MAVYPGLRNYRLSSLASNMSIGYDAHSAISDSRALMQIMNRVAGYKRVIGAFSVTVMDYVATHTPT